MSNPIVLKHLQAITRELGYDWSIFERRQRGWQHNEPTFSRNAYYVKARTEVWAEARRRETPQGTIPSYPEIAAACDCCHTTVITACQRAGLSAGEPSLPSGNRGGGDNRRGVRRTDGKANAHVGGDTASGVVVDAAPPDTGNGGASDTGGDRGGNGGLRPYGSVLRSTAREELRDACRYGKPRN